MARKGWDWKIVKSPSAMVRRSKSGPSSSSQSGEYEWNSCCTPVPTAWKQTPPADNTCLCTEHENKVQIHKQVLQMYTCKKAFCVCMRTRVCVCVVQPMEQGGWNKGRWLSSKCPEWGVILIPPRDRRIKMDWARDKVKERRWRWWLALQQQDQRWEERRWEIEF